MPSVCVSEGHCTKPAGSKQPGCFRFSISSFRLQSRNDCVDQSKVIPFDTTVVTVRDIKVPEIVVGYHDHLNDCASAKGEKSQR